MATPLSASSAGVRRVEALTGQAALGYLREQGALFVFVQEEEKFRLLVRAQDYVEAQVEEHLAKFQAECAAELEGQ